MNCFSSQDAGTVWQQFAVYANPDDGQLHAIIETWNPARAPVNNIDVPFANVPNPIPAGYAINIALTYYQEPQLQYSNQYTVIVNGAVFKVTDKADHVVGTTTITIPGHTLTTTSQPATFANLAPVKSFQLNIVGDYNKNTATLTQGAGKITYNAASDSESGMTVTQFGPPGPGDVLHNPIDTGENANVVYGPLPWPWSTSMTNVGTQFVQLFRVTPAASTDPWIA